jgi:hypothetical protein
LNKERGDDGHQAKGRSVMPNWIWTLLGIGIFIYFMRRWIDERARKVLEERERAREAEQKSEALEKPFAASSRPAAPPAFGHAAHSIGVLDANPNGRMIANARNPNLGAVRFAQVQHHFYLNNDGMGCRYRNFAELEQRYTQYDLLTEVRAVLNEVEVGGHMADTLFLRGMSYLYLYAHSFFIHYMMAPSRDKAADFIEKFEKLSAPTFSSRLFGSRPPQKVLENYNVYKKQLPILERIHQLSAYIMEASGNYGAYADTIKANLTELDQLIASGPPEQQQKFSRISTCLGW